MTLFLPLEWLSWVSAIFDGFTFTDWYDFIPLSCLACGLLAAGFSRLLFSRPATLWLKGILASLAVWPLYPSVPLTMLALQVVKGRGAWPQVMVDDPKGLVGLSPSYDFWFHATNYTEAIAGAAFVTFFALFYANRERLSKKLKWSTLGLYCVATVITFFDPGLLSTWWLD